MPAEPLLSVCIPTKNRQETLVPCVRAALRLGPAVEIVVLDTSDDDTAREPLAQHAKGDPRLHYHYRREMLSFAETFDAVIQLAGGSYVTVIGDDDAVLPGAVDFARYARARGVDAVTPTLPAFYNWPNFRHRHYGASDSGLLAVREFTGTVEQADPGVELRRSARRAFQNFERLPRIYYGIVARTCLDELQERAGGCFFGSSPDISGAVGLANVVRSYILVDAPLFLPGSSATSGSGKSGMKHHVGDLRTSHQTSAFAQHWPSSVPPVYSVQTVWAQSALATLERVDRHGAAEQMNVGSLHAQTLVHNPSSAALVLRSLVRQLGPAPEGLRILLDFFVACLTEGFKRPRGLLFHSLGRGYYRYVFTRRGVPDVADAAAILVEVDSVLAVGPPPESATRPLFEE